MTMAVPKIMLRVEEPDWDDLSVRAHREIARNSYAAVGKFWVEKYLPDHFQPYSGAKYGYQPRTKKYLQRKRALAARGLVRDGGAVDLVFSGRSRQMLLRPALIRAYPTRVTLDFDAPDYFTIRFNPRGRGRRQPDKMDELSRTIPSQERHLADVLHETAAAQIAAYRGQRKQTIKG